MFELPGSTIQTQYFLEVLLTVLLCIALAGIVLEGARVVDSLEQQTGATSISMGFLQLVKASYLSGETPDDWIVTCASHGNAMPGFGAPLWVILMSVIGAVLIAIGVILRGLGTCRLDASTPDGRKKIHAASQNLVKHQMLILFAPLGAMFLYQIMLLTGTADENLTVGLAALAAGGGMNALLNKAHGLVASLLQSEEQRAGKKTAQRKDNEDA
jgi:hypothetical protein